MGGLDTEITDATTTVVLEIAWFEPLGVMQTAAPARAALGGVGAVRARLSIRTGSTPPSPGSPNCCARRVPTSSCTPGADDARGRRPAAAEQRRPTCASPRSTGSSARRLAADDLPGAARPDRLHRVAATATRAPSRCRRGAPTRPRRSTWSRRSPATTATTASARRVPKSIVHGGLTVRQQRRRLLREVLLGLGISEAMPNPFLAPDTQANGRPRRPR